MFSSFSGSGSGLQELKRVANIVATARNKLNFFIIKLGLVIGEYSYWFYMLQRYVYFFVFQCFCVFN